MGCIFYLSFASPSTFKSIPTFDNEDKLVHVLMYFGLVLILILDFNSAFKKKKLKPFVFISLCIIFPIILGGLVEIFQPMFFSPRTASWFDWYADIVGVLIAWGGMYLIKKTPKFNT
jgi:VanZ family protein